MADPHTHSFHPISTTTLTLPAYSGTYEACQVSRCLMCGELLTAVVLLASTRPMPALREVRTALRWQRAYPERAQQALTR